MVEIWLPYGSSEIPARIPEERLIDIMKPQKTAEISDPSTEVRRLAESHQKFIEAVKAAQHTCIVLGESTNTELASQATKTLLDSLFSAGIQQDTITVVRIENAPEPDPSLAGNVKVVSHDPLSSSTIPVQGSMFEFPISMNSIFAEANLRILLGEIKPHNFLGYSGLSDIVFPGLVSRNSALCELSDRKGMTVSDLQKGRFKFVQSFTNLFALGFVLNADLAPAKLAFGGFEDCLKELQTTVQSVCVNKVQKAADIVVMSAGGRPVDKSLLNAVETLPTALPALKKDGVIIVAAECSSGHGNTEFYEWCAEHKEPRYLEARLKHSFNYNGFKAAFLLRTLEDHRIYLVSTIPDHYVENVFRMRPASTVNSALQTVQRTLGSDSTISVIPDASRVIPVKETS